VNSAIYLRDGSNNIMTGSSDGTVKVWESKTTECLLTIRPGMHVGMSAFSEIPIMSLVYLPNSPDQILAILKSSQVILLQSLTGQTLKTFSSGKSKGGDFVSATVSSLGKWLYCAGEDRLLYVFDLKTGELEDVINPMNITDDIIQIIHHPNRNLLAVVMNNGKIQMLAP